MNRRTVRLSGFWKRPRAALRVARRGVGDAVLTTGFGSSAVERGQRLDDSRLAPPRRCESSCLTSCQLSRLSSAASESKDYNPAGSRLGASAEIQFRVRALACVLALDF